MNNNYGKFRTIKECKEIATKDIGSNTYVGKDDHYTYNPIKSRLFEYGPKNNRRTYSVAYADYQ